MKSKILFFLICFITVKGIAQKPKPLYDKKFTPLSITLNFGFQKPANDLAQRFGNNLAVGGGAEYIRLPSGWLINLNASYIFGNVVNEDVLSKIRTSDGNIITDINTYADISLRERGLYTGANIGKIIKIHDDGNHFGGIRLTLGAGWLYHKIRLQDNQNNVPQLATAYAKGYDRFTAGIAITQFIGYQMVSRDRTLNFYAGFEATEGFTKNQRGFNFDTQQRDDKKRQDILYGVKIGWQIILFSNTNVSNIEY